MAGDEPRYDSLGRLIFELKKLIRWCRERKEGADNDIEAEALDETISHLGQGLQTLKIAEGASAQDLDVDELLGQADEWGDEEGHWHGPWEEER